MTKGAHRWHVWFALALLVPDGGGFPRSYILPSVEALHACEVEGNLDRLDKLDEFARLVEGVQQHIPDTSLISCFLLRNVGCFCMPPPCASWLFSLLSTFAQLPHRLHKKPRDCLPYGHVEEFGYHHGFQYLVLQLLLGVRFKKRANTFVEHLVTHVWRYTEAASTVEARLLGALHLVELTGTMTHSQMCAANPRLVDAIRNDDAPVCACS